MAGLIATVLAGAFVAVLVATLRTAQVTRALAADATEAAVIGAYLTRDARSVAVLESLAAVAVAADDPTSNDGSLGLSTIDSLGCMPPTAANLIVRLAWPGRDSTASTASVVTYALDPVSGELIRTACDRRDAQIESTPVPVVLGRGFASVTADCGPATCTGLPEMMTFTMTGDSGVEPFRYSLDVGLRTDAQPGPENLTDVSVAVLGDGRCPTLDLLDGGQVRAAHDVVVEASCAVPLRDDGGQFRVGGSIVFVDAAVDPYASILDEPAVPTPPGGPNPFPIGRSDSPASVVVHPQPVAITVDTAFAPGVYVFERGLSVGADVRVTGDDVMWFVDGGLTVASSASINLDAPDSGPYQGIVLWAASDGPVLIGNDATPSSFDGIVYAPDAHVTITRRAGVCLDAVVARSLTFAGNGPVHLGYGADLCDTTASLWTPSALGTRALMWLDAADATSVTVNAADSLSEWRDRSGRGHHTLQMQSHQQPTWETGAINGLAATRFDGVDDALGFDGTFIVGREYSIAAASVRVSARPSNLYLGSAGTQLGLGWEANDALAHTHADTSVRADVDTFSAGDRAEVHLTTAATTGRVLRRDGVERAASPGIGPVDSWPGAAVGAGRGSSFDGHVGEIIIIDGALSSAEMSRLEAYLAWKWGTAGSLPVDHVHASVPPLSYAPGAPVEVAAVAGDGDAAISWMGPSATGRRAPDRFVVQYATSADFAEPVTVEASHPAAEPSSVTADLLVNDAPMWVRVAGSNEWGIGPFSAAGPVTPRDYRSAVFAAVPTAYWRLGEPSGDVAYDETEAQMHGSVYDAASSVQGAVGASADTAIGFGVAAGRVEFAVPAALSPPEPGVPDSGVPDSGVPDSGVPDSGVPDSGVTVSVWFRANDPGVVLARTEGDVTAALVYIGSDGRLRGSFAVTNDPADDEVAVAGPVLDGLWHHAVSTSDGSTLRLHLDGALVATARVSSQLAATEPAVLSLGGSSVGSGWPSSPSSTFTGEVDELSVHSHMLATAEIAALHRSGVTGTNDLVAPGAPDLDLRPTPSRVTASWGPADPGDDVVGFRVFRNGVLIDQQSTTEPVVDLAYADDTDAVYSLEAYDHRGNRSSAKSRTARPMVLTVDTRRSSGMTVGLPLRGAVDAVVDWQGTCATTPPSRTTEVVDSTRTVDVACTYEQPGTYTVRVFGSVAHYGLGAQAGGLPSPSQDKFISVNAWGDLGTTSLVGAFVRATNLTSVPVDLPGTVTDTSFMFQRSSSFNQDLGGWDTSNVTAMSYMFQYASTFNNGCASGAAQCPSIGGWKTSRVTRTDRMFESANAFNQNIGAWDMSSVTTLQAMFYAVAGTNPTFNNGCAIGVSSPACATIGSWDTGNVVSLRTTFLAATAFNQDISGWDTGRVTSMHQTFSNASRFDQPIGSWDVSNVQTMWRAFSGATLFDQELSGWRPAKVSDMGDMFRSASRFNRDLSGWCVPLVSTTPSNFATGATAWVLPKPVWGTCPGS